MENDKKSKEVYELGYHVSSLLSEDNVAPVVGEIKDVLTSAGAEVVSEEYPTNINLAYSIDHVVNNKKTVHNSAYFGWIKFDVSADKIFDIKKTLKDNENIIRLIVLKTLSSNTLYGKKTLSQVLSSDIADTSMAGDLSKVEVPKEEAPKKELAEEEKKDIDENKVDEKIDDLLAEEK